jgi:hypothetical protein
MFACKGPCPVPDLLAWESVMEFSSRYVELMITSTDASTTVVDARLELLSFSFRLDDRLLVFSGACGVRSTSSWLLGLSIGSLEGVLALVARLSRNS